MGIHTRCLDGYDSDIDNIPISVPPWWGFLVHRIISNKGDWYYCRFARLTCMVMEDSRRHTAHNCCIVLDLQEYVGGLFCSTFDESKMRSYMQFSVFDYITWSRISNSLGPVSHLGHPTQST
jgi:hypothetical protein